MKSLLLVGGGGHCRSSIDVIEAGGRYKIAGIVEQDNFGYTSVMGYPLLGNDDSLSELLEQYESALVTVGQIESADARIRLFKKLKDLSADTPTIVSPHAYISPHAHIGAGTIVMHSALVNANADIAENCILNNQVLIEHDVSIESHCHVSTGAKVNGGVKIGMGSFIGSGSVIREGLRIGTCCTIGAGAVVLNDLPAGTVFRGKV